MNRLHLYDCKAIVKNLCFLSNNTALYVLKNIIHFQMCLFVGQNLLFFAEYITILIPKIKLCGIKKSFFLKSSFFQAFPQKGILLRLACNNGY